MAKKITFDEVLHRAANLQFLLNAYDFHLDYLSTLFSRMNVKRDRITYMKNFHPMSNRESYLVDIGVELDLEKRHISS